VRVPDEAGDGTAKIKLSFADWKEGNVTPAVLERPVTNVPAASGQPATKK
jgi:hypothetical protein